MLFCWVKQKIFIYQSFVKQLRSETFFEIAFDPGWFLATVSPAVARTFVTMVTWNLHRTTYSHVDPVAYARGGEFEDQLPPPTLKILKEIKTSLFGTNRLFSYRDCRNCCHAFLCYPTCL